MSRRRIEFQCPVRGRPRGRRARKPLRTAGRTARNDAEKARKQNRNSTERLPERIRSACPGPVWLPWERRGCPGRRSDCRGKPSGCPEVKLTALRSGRPADWPCCHGKIDSGPQTWAYCHGNIHIWKTDRAAARDLGGVGAPSSIVLEQIGGVAIRCTIMVFRRLWASKVACLSTSAPRLGHIAMVIYIYGKPIALPLEIWGGSKHHLRYCWSRSGGSQSAAL